MAGLTDLFAPTPYAPGGGRAEGLDEILARASAAGGKSLAAQNPNMPASQFQMPPGYTGTPLRDSGAAADRLTELVNGPGMPPSVTSAVPSMIGAGSIPAEVLMQNPGLVDTYVRGDALSRSAAYDQLMQLSKRR